MKIKKTEEIMEDFYIYLAGNIKKGKEEENDQAWTEEDRTLLQCLIPEKRLVFLNPAHRSDDLSDQQSVFGRDLFQVFSSHLVFVDARGKRGLGVGAEMMFAKMNQIPVVAWLPEESHYQRKQLSYLGQDIEGWIHPFVENLTDFRAPSLEVAANWINNVLLKKENHFKGPLSLKEAINHYLTTQLKRDHGMKELVSANKYFVQKIDSLKR